MIVDGWTVGLTVGGGMLLLPLLHGGSIGCRILRAWDPTRATAVQLRLEREAELAATVIDVVLGLLVLQAALFLMLLDRLADLLSGAMCAIGVLRASRFAVPALVAKGAALLAFVVWRTVHRADSLGEGFPFTRLKAGLLCGLILPLALADLALQTAMLVDLQPDVVTSCCSVAFRLAPSPAVALLDSLGPGPTLGIFLGGLALLLATGAAAWHGTARRQHAARSLIAHGVAALLFFFVVILAATALFGGYIYGSPAHRCPLCLLRGEPAWLGWPLYLALLAGTAQAVAGTTLGLLQSRPGGWSDELLAVAGRRVRASLLLDGLAAILLAGPAVLWHLRHGVSIWS